MAAVRIENLVKSYPGEKGRPGKTAVDHVNIEIRHREFMVLVGPSGCGKSTTLRMIAGLEDISSGAIYIDDRIVRGESKLGLGFATQEPTHPSQKQS